MAAECQISDTCLAISEKFAHLHSPTGAVNIETVLAHTDAFTQDNLAKLNGIDNANAPTLVFNQAA